MAGGVGSIYIVQWEQLLYYAPEVAHTKAGTGECRPGGTRISTSSIVTTSQVSLRAFEISY